MTSYPEGTTPTAREARRRASDLDLRVAARVRERRVALGLSLLQVAERLGITYQQVHKYETGINRLAAGRLYQVVRALETELNYFFAGPELAEQSRPAGQSRTVLELARNLAAVQSGRERDAIRAFVRDMAGGSAGRADSDGHRPMSERSSS